MIVTGNIKKIKEYIAGKRKRGASVGFVPTMGALHAGHLSLVAQAKEDCDLAVVSIFVNPTQFGPKEDYRLYPRTLSYDTKLLHKLGVDLIFVPTVATMYSKQATTVVEETSLSRLLCGKSRPGHFQGVCTVLAKLFNIVQPDRAYFGQKDYQQSLIVRRMVADLHLPVTIKVLGTVREKDGLALSSRNQYLSSSERHDARLLSVALKKGVFLIRKGHRKPSALRRHMKAVLAQGTHIRIDYLEIVDAATLERCLKIQGKILLAGAIFVGKTRLIDNKLVVVHG